MPDLLRRRGHNLLEVVLAATIFATAVVAMIGIWAVYHSSLTKSRNMLVATGLARSVLEQRVAGGYGSLDLILGVPQVDNFQSRSQVRGRLVQSQFKSTFLATDSATPGFRRLVVTIEWDEDTGKKSLAYETCLFKTQ